MAKRYQTETGIARLVAEAPPGCGVYLLRDSAGDCLYVGKSIDVRKRLVDHLKAAGQGVEKEALIMGGAARVEYLLTKNELEALILENTLIKRHQPRYNVLLRDDKTYPYLRVNPREAFPRLTVTRRPRVDGALYFGPYVSVAAMRKTVHYIGTLFPLRTCEDDRPPKRSRPCLNFEIGRCLGPCAGKVTAEHYHETVDELILFLKGKQLTLKKRLQKKMLQAATAMRFEEAARLRDRLRAMSQFFERQDVFATDLPSADVVGLAQGAEGWTAYVLLVRHGHVVGGEPHRLQADPYSGEAEVLQGFLERFYSGRDEVPAKVVLPVAVEEADLLERFLTSRAGRRVRLLVPSRGRGLELLLLARRNALTMQRRRGRRTTTPPKDLWGDLVPDGGRPERIEVYDASSLRGQDTVVGMVLWEGGAFRKSGYRRFRIRTAPGSDDYAAIREAVGRRAARIRKGEERAPDLVLVDGGAGHVSAVRGELDRGGLSAVQVVGISKGERRREGDRLHLVDGSIPSLPPEAPLVRFLGSLRDEVHRYAVGYHRLLRGMAMKASMLDEVPGLGPRRKAILVSHFGDPHAVVAATLDDLLAVPGLPPVVAKAVYAHFHS